MSRNSYIIYMLLLTLLIILRGIYDSPQPMNIWEFMDWVKGR